MIPLEKNYDLSESAQEFTQDLNELEKYPLEASDIWKVVLKYQSKSIMKAVVTYFLSEMSSIIYALMMLYLLDVLTNTSIGVDSRTLFWPYFGISFACIYDAIITGAGYRELIIASNKIKGSIFLALYNRIILVQPLLLKQEL